MNGFEDRIEPFRTELLAYCYRMLGSPHDAEDLVQDTYLRARPSGLVAASDPLGSLIHGGEITWLQPLPDALLHAGDPAGVAVDRASVRLVFAGALQRLSARERGAVILRDVLGFSAAETADVLGLSVAAVNSALQRGRSRLRASGADDEDHAPPAAQQKAWIERYMKAFEQADIAGLKHLLTDDVVMEMPPMTNWFAGPDNYGAFMTWVFEVGGTRLAPDAGRRQRPAGLRRLPTGP